MCDTNFCNILAIPITILPNDALLTLFFKSHNIDQHTKNTTTLQEKYQFDMLAPFTDDVQQHS